MKFSIDKLKKIFFPKEEAKAVEAKFENINALLPMSEDDDKVVFMDENEAELYFIESFWELEKEEKEKLYPMFKYFNKNIFDILINYWIKKQDFMLKEFQILWWEYSEAIGKMFSREPFQYLVTHGNESVLKNLIEEFDWWNITLHIVNHGNHLECIRYLSLREEYHGITRRRSYKIQEGFDKNKGIDFNIQRSSNWSGYKREGFIQEFEFNNNYIKLNIISCTHASEWMFAYNLDMDFLWKQIIEKASKKNTIYIEAWTYTTEWHFYNYLNKLKWIQLDGWRMEYINSSYNSFWDIAKEYAAKWYSFVNFDLSVQDPTNTIKFLRKEWCDDFLICQTIYLQLKEYVDNIDSQKSVFKNLFPDLDIETITRILQVLKKTDGKIWIEKNYHIYNYLREKFMYECLERGANNWDLVITHPAHIKELLKSEIHHPSIDKLSYSI